MKFRSVFPMLKKFSLFGKFVRKAKPHFNSQHNSKNTVLNIELTVCRLVLLKTVFDLLTVPRYQLVVFVL